MPDNYDYLDEEVNQEIRELRAKVPQLKQVLDLVTSSEVPLDSFYERLKTVVADENSSKFILQDLAGAGVVSIHKEGDSSFFISLTPKGDLIKTKS